MAMYVLLAIPILPLVMILVHAHLPLPVQLQDKSLMELLVHVEMDTITMDQPVLLVLPTVWYVLLLLLALRVLVSTLYQVGLALSVLITAKSVLQPQFVPNVILVILLILQIYV